MKIRYKISVESSVEVPNSDWEELKESFRGNLQAFAKYVAADSCGTHRGLTITSIEGAPDELRKP